MQWVIGDFQRSVARVEWVVAVLQNGFAEAQLPPKSRNYENLLEVS